MKAALILITITSLSVAYYDCTGINVVGHNYDQTQSIPLISNGVANTLDPEKLYELRSFTFDEEYV